MLQLTAPCLMKIIKLPPTLPLHPNPHLRDVTLFLVNNARWQVVLEFKAQTGDVEIFLIQIFPTMEILLTDTAR